VNKLNNFSVDYFEIPKKHRAPHKIRSGRVFDTLDRRVNETNTNKAIAIT